MSSLFQIHQLSLSLSQIEASLNSQTPEGLKEARAALHDFLNALETGELRAASPSADQWQCHVEVKRLILLAFKASTLEEREGFCDKDLLWPKTRSLAALGSRLVPGGSAIRRGAYIAASVTIMPPAYINVGAYVDSQSMIDSHVLVGSCAQIGKRCHISAAAQIGGVLEPIQALPVIVEDQVFVGGNCGLYEGVHLHRGAVLAAGLILTASTKIYDLVEERCIEAKDGVLAVPENAVLIPGTRPLQQAYAQKLGLSAYTPILVKYRDEKTAAATVLEEVLR